MKKIKIELSLCLCMYVCIYKHIMYSQCILYQIYLSIPKSSCIVADLVHFDFEDQPLQPFCNCLDLCIFKSLKFVLEANPKHNRDFSLRDIFHQIASKIPTKHSYKIQVTSLHCFQSFRLHRYCDRSHAVR